MTVLVPSAPTPGAPPVGFSLDQVSNPIYVFAPTSQHENQVVVHLTNPLPEDIPCIGDEVIEIVVSTTAPGDPNPNALTTPDEIPAIVMTQVVQNPDGSWSPVTVPHWDMQKVSQENNQYTFRLTPSTTNPPSPLLSAQKVLSVSLDHVVTSLANTVGKITVAARNIQGLDPLSRGTFSMNIDPYPAPMGNLNPMPVQTAGEPLRVSWTTQFVDTLTLRFTDVVGNVVTRSMALGEIHGNAVDFELLPILALSGWLELIGRNDSNAVPLHLQQRVDVAGTMTIEGAIDLGWPSGLSPSAETWTVTPAGLLKAFEPSWTTSPGLMFQDQVDLTFTTAQLPDLKITANWQAALGVNQGGSGPPSSLVGEALAFDVQWENQHSSQVGCFVATTLGQETPPAFSNCTNGVSGPDAYQLTLNDTDQGWPTISVGIVISRPYTLDAGPAPARLTREDA